MSSRLRLGFVLVCGTCALAVSPDAVRAADKVPVRVDDLYRHDAPTDVRVLRNGRRAIYVREWTAPGLFFPRSALWTARLDGDDRLVAAALEPSEPDARRPVLSPNEDRIACLSTRPFPDGRPAVEPVPVWSDPATDIWLVPTAGGKAIPLAGPSKPYGRVFADPFYAGVAFSPDGRQLAFVADDGTSLRTKEERELGITVVREDQGEGYEGFGPASIWVADLDPDPRQGIAAKHVRRLTPDDAWYGDPHWTSDGKSLIVHANRTPQRESVRFSINRNFDLWRIDVADGKLVRLTDGPGPQVSPRVSPDGRHAACLSVPRNGPHTDVYDVLLVPLDGSGPPRLVVDRRNESKEPAFRGDVTFPLPEQTWVDPRTLHVNLADGAKSGTATIDIEQGDPVEIPRPVVRAGQTAQKLAPPKHPFVAERLVGEERVVRWKSGDGLEIEGLVTLPPPEVGCAPHPLLVFPHGGPHGRSALGGFRFRQQLFAAHGYAVFEPNFRGSTGYGLRFLDADRDDLGGGDMEDVLTGIEHLVAEKLVDPERQFVHGISYGGYMTCRLVGHTKQFRAAVPQNAVTHLDAMWGTSDIQSWTEWEFGGRPWEVPEKMRKHSPFSYVGRVRTPTLVLHADRDRRCPLAMGLMFHRGLKSAGVETEMVVYHDERHGIARLDRQADTLRRTLEWFAKHDVRR